MDKWPPRKHRFPGSGGVLSAPSTHEATGRSQNRFEWQSYSLLTFNSEEEQGYCQPYSWDLPGKSPQRPVLGMLDCSLHGRTEACLARELRSAPRLLLLLLSHFSRVRFCATPSLGFSTQEHWSGLPFPSPMHESENWKWSHSVVSNS